jgi:hypothetical protein
MIVLAHRGLWRGKRTQNSIEALREALILGLGIETDIRDDRGRVVISHDSPAGSEPMLEELLQAYRETGSKAVLALNVKADGLHASVHNLLSQYHISPGHYFLFDMSPPDALGYLSRSMPCFTRVSEVEPVPAFIDRASGVWLDCFYRDWIDEDAIMLHCVEGRRVALVSPELHGRDKTGAWSQWRSAFTRLQREGRGDSLFICTDHPVEARAYFDVKD